MANRILAHPNPAYLKSDGTLNVSGQIKLYVSGTTTPKIAYKDAVGTSYGSTIDLNSSGLPTDGPIYWDSAQLYKVEVYTRVDDTPTYALDYTVDSYGMESSAISNIITQPVNWRVDKVGATATTFATIEAAFDEARNWIIMGDGTLEIFIEAGTYTNETVNLSHPQGQYIRLVGEDRTTTIVERTTNTQDSVLELSSGDRLDSISGVTITTTHASVDGVVVRDGAMLNELNVTMSGNSSATGLFVIGGTVNNQLVQTKLIMDGFDTGIRATLGGRVYVQEYTGTEIQNKHIQTYDIGTTVDVSSCSANSTPATASIGINAVDGSRISAESLYMGDATVGLKAEMAAHIRIGALLSMVAGGTHGAQANTTGTIIIEDTTPVITGYTNQYTVGIAGTVHTANTIGSTTVSSADTSIIYQA